jgi:hypothetical protein
MYRKAAIKLSFRVCCPKVPLIKTEYPLVVGRSEIGRSIIS